MTEDVREQVRQRYAQAAQAVTATGANALAVVDADQCRAPTSVERNDCCCGSTGEGDAAFGPSLYGADEQGELPAEAVNASLGCGNPTAVVELRAGEKVLDLARANATKAGKIGRAHV